jgi:hypothetical protein
MKLLRRLLRRVRSAAKHQRKGRLLLESLEDRCVPAGPLLIYHNVQTDANGNIAPWYSPDPGISYDHILGLVWDYWNNLPNDPYGYGQPEYYSVRVTNYSDYLGIGGDQLTMAINSWILYYQYSGDQAVLQNAEDIADYYLANSLTPSTYVYGNVPYPCNLGDTGNQLVYDGDLVAGPGVLQPDKAGSFGDALVSLYKVTGISTYLDAAVNIADTLAATVSFNADNEHSPWPFRVVAETGEEPPAAFSPHTTNYGPTLSLFQSLSNMNQGNVTEYNTVFNYVLQWMHNPMTTNHWGPFFEDIYEDSDSEINADTWAYYIMQNPSWDPNWQQDVRSILNWSSDALGDPTWNNINWTNYGVIPIDEQTAYQVPGNSHTARHGATELTYDALTGDTTNTAAAIHQLNWATYMVDNNGANAYPDGAIWLTDGYGDYVRHYLRAMAADPALAPYNESHLLSTSSYVKSIQYDPDSIAYTTADSDAQDVLRIAFTPSEVTAGGVPLPQLASIADLQTQDGYTLNAPGDVPGVLRIHHSQSANVAITNGQANGLPPGFVDRDFGSPGLPGTASFDGTTWTVEGGGADMWGNAQQFNFVYQTVSGDQTIIARVYSVQDTDPWAGAGVLFRDGTATTAAYANVFVTPAEGVSFQWRPSAGAACRYVQVAGVVVPEWVKLVRANGKYSAFYSADGTNWIALGSPVSITFTNSNYYLGLAVTAHDNAALNTSTFRDVSISAGTLALSPDVLPSAVVGSPYRVTIGATGGSGTYTFAVTAGSLPAWLTLNATTGVLSGTPTGPATYTFTITATDSNISGLFGTHAYTLLVNQAPAFTSAASTTFTVGMPGSFTVTASGSPVPTLSESNTDSLPSGVAFNAATGVLGGTPAVNTGGTYTLHFTAHNGVGSDASQVFTLTVNQAAAFTSAASAIFTVGMPGSFTVTASGFPVPILTESNTDTLPSGVTFNAATGILSGTPAAGSSGTYSLHFTAHNGVGSDASQTFVLTVSQAQAPFFTSATSTTFTVGVPGSFTVTAGGFPVPILSESNTDTLPSGITFNAATGVLGGTPAANTGGTYTLHFTAHNGIGSDATQTFTLTVNQAAAFTSAASATFTVGTPGSFTVTASGFPIPVLSESNTDTLPSGVTFNADTGILSGTPATGTSGTYSLHFTAHNGVGSDASQTFTLTVNQANGLPPGFVDKDFGSPRYAGSATFDGTTWTVKGGGADMWNNVQQFNFVYQTVSGDQTIIARVNSVQNTNSWAGAGVLFQDGNATTAAYANVFVTPGQGVAFQWRPTAGASCGYAQVTGIRAPQWVKLARAGGTYSAFYSADGTNWSALGSPVAITFANSNYFAGLAVTAHNNAALNTSTFRNVSINAGTLPLGPDTLPNAPANGGPYSVTSGAAGGAGTYSLSLNAATPVLGGTPAANIRGAQTPRLAAERASRRQERLFSSFARGRDHEPTWLVVPPSSGTEGLQWALPDRD